MQKMVAVGPSVIIIALFLSACATTFDPRACPREREYTRAEQKIIAAEFKKAPVIIQGVAVDYGKLRDMARACRGEAVRR